MRIVEWSGAWQSPLPGNEASYAEHLRTPDLSLGTYRIVAGGVDGQRPHTEDEVYVVVSGRARIVTPTGNADVGPGSVIFVPAGEEHRFVDITEDLTLIVVFGPAEGARSPA
ncbi:MAG TPA: cupin domain-containing protein [Pilimelia sp.]|nr:cupin domain-containing protein [Pilimelia sp.]